jgi:hypothetical protein
MQRYWLLNYQRESQKMHPLITHRGIKALLTAKADKPQQPTPQPGGFAYVFKPSVPPKSLKPSTQTSKE